MLKPYGSLGYRCAHYGVFCDGMLLPDASQASFASCRAATPADGGKLSDLQKYIQFFTAPASQGGVKQNPRNVILTSIAGPPEPVSTFYSTSREDCGAGLSGCTQLQHSCVSLRNPAFFADPAVRLSTVVQAAAHHQSTSICDEPYAPTMELLGGMINAAIPPSCFPLALPDPVRPNCVVEDVTHTADGEARRPVPSCATTTSAPCWNLYARPECPAVCNPLTGTAQQVGVSISRSVAAPPDTRAEVRCEVVREGTVGKSCGTTQ